ncbi:hypothetical protein Tco_0079941 [Tanacetum coccineum]
MWGNGCRTLNRHILRITLRASGRRKRKKSVGCGSGRQENYESGVECEAPPVIKGSLDANEDIGVVEVSSKIDDVFDIGESNVESMEVRTCGVGENELNKVISALKDGGGEFDGRLDEVNLNLSEELADNGVSPIPTSLVAHESPRVRQLWERIGIGDAHGLMDNGRNHKFVQLNVRDGCRTLNRRKNGVVLCPSSGRRKRKKGGLVEAIDSLVPLDEHFATFRGNGYSRKGQKESQKQQNQARDGKDKVKSKPNCIKSMLAIPHHSQVLSMAEIDSKEAQKKLKAGICFRMTSHNKHTWFKLSQKKHKLQVQEMKTSAINRAFCKPLRHLSFN